MGNFLKGISWFVARDAGAATAADAAPSVAAPDGEGADQGHGREEAAEVLPRVAYPCADEESAPRKSRPSRALNLLRTSTQVAVTLHPMPAHNRTARAHGPQPRGVVLTETERIRLQIMQVQIRLSSIELYEGPIDGVLNPDTATGLRHFQMLKGLRDSGSLTAGTLTALGVPPIV